MSAEKDTITLAVVRPASIDETQSICEVCELTDNEYGFYGLHFLDLSERYCGKLGDDPRDFLYDNETGDRLDPRDKKDLKQIMSNIKEKYGDCVIKCLDVYDHSSCVFSASDPDNRPHGWDLSHIGLVFARKEDIKNAYDFAKKDGYRDGFETFSNEDFFNAGLDAFTNLYEGYNCLAVDYYKIDKKDFPEIAENLKNSPDAYCGHKIEDTGDFQLINDSDSLKGMISCEQNDAVFFADKLGLRNTFYGSDDYRCLEGFDPAFNPKLDEILEDCKQASRLGTIEFEGLAQGDAYIDAPEKKTGRGMH